MSWSILNVNDYMIALSFADKNYFMTAYVNTNSLDIELQRVFQLQLFFLSLHHKRIIYIYIYSTQYLLHILESLHYFPFLLAGFSFAFLVQ